MVTLFHLQKYIVKQQHLRQPEAVHLERAQTGIAILECLWGARQPIKSNHIGKIVLRLLRKSNFNLLNEDNHETLQI